MIKKLVATLVAISLFGLSALAFTAPPHQPGHRGVVQEARMDPVGGPIPHRDWHGGERVPGEFRHHNFVVDDWHQHGLNPPPRGYQWVGVNGDYVLAAIGTGIIASIVAAGR